jgi:hypothetical protein
LRSRPVLGSLLAAAAILASFVIPSPARAGGAVLPRVGSPDPNALDIRIAVATTGAGTTRWTEVTTPAATRALWLVPARPGAAIDWAPDGWLAALDDATAVRVLPPSAPAPCPVPSSPERAAAWTRTATKRAPAAVAVHPTADAAKAHAAEHGYEVTPAVAAQIASLYQSGWNLVSIELASTWSASSSGTLRVSDDGGAVLPLALTGSRAASTYVTAFTIGAGVASLPGTRDVDATAIRWGQRGSSYAEWRRNAVEGAGGSAWVRESASHAALFDGTAFAGGSPAPSVAAAYFVNNACASSAQAAGSSAGTVGVSCAPGDAARVPGGLACTPAPGTIDPSSVSCGDGARDLAFALSGASPADVVVTRWAGVVARGGLGADLPIGFDPTAAPRRPVVRASSYEACATAPADPPITPPSGSSSGYDPGSSAGGGGSSSSGGVYVEPGCGGSTTTASTTTYEEYEETDPPPDDTSSDSCSGGTTTTSSDEGWDSDDSGDSCSGDDSSSSSSSSDSCSGGSSSSSSSGGSDDGWDTEDEASPTGAKVKPAAKKPHALRKTKKKSPSPVSRYALLGVALLLPLRRRGRANL